MEGRGAIMEVRITELPELIYLNDFKGDYHAFINAVYESFERDFIKHRTKFGSHSLGFKRKPLFQDRAYTFYHMTHKGENESERVPDLRRCERMPWARPTIENVEKYGLRFWEQERNGKHRICIWLSVDNGDNYFVILDVRKSYVLLWTAFFADYPHQLKKKEKEYISWKENHANTCTPEELVREIVDKI